MHPHGLPIRCHAFGVPKRGNLASEYEDAHRAAPDQGRFAIADGASESWYAGVWARLIVDEYVVNPVTPAEQWEAWLPPVQERWLRAISGRPVPWYGEDKVREGAFATFLGVDIGIAGCDDHPRWEAVAVGDSCLFVVRDGQLQEAFPIKQSADFGNEPCLLGSRAPPGDVRDHRKESRAGGEWRPGDRIWLMTDALAHWFLRRTEGGSRPWEAVGDLLAMTPAGDAFARWVENLRANDGLR